MFALAKDRKFLKFAGKMLFGGVGVLLSTNIFEAILFQEMEEAAEFAEENKLDGYEPVLVLGNETGNGECLICDAQSETELCWECAGKLHEMIKCGYCDTMFVPSYDEFFEVVSSLCSDDCELGDFFCSESDESKER